jgi:hypothetical protein
MGACGRSVGVLWSHCGICMEITVSAWVCRMIFVDDMDFLGVNYEICWEYGVVYEICWR